MIAPLPVRQVGRLFDWITSAPGALHRLKVGQIAPGFLANLVIWDFDHPATWPSPDPVRTLVMTNATAAIDQMMLRGQWIGEAENFKQALWRVMPTKTLTEKRASDWRICLTGCRRMLRQPMARYVDTAADPHTAS